MLQRRGLGCARAFKDKEHAQMNAMRKWSIGFVLTTLVVVVSYAWLDRPIAFFAHDQLQRYDLFAKLTYLPEIITPLVLLAFAAIGLHALLGRQLPKLETVAVLLRARDRRGRRRTRRRGFPFPRRRDRRRFPRHLDRLVHCRIVGARRAARARGCAA